MNDKKRSLYQNAFQALIVASDYAQYCETLHSPVYDAIMEVLDDEMLADGIMDLNGMTNTECSAIYSHCFDACDLTEEFEKWCEEEGDVNAVLDFVVEQMRKNARQYASNPAVQAMC